VETKDALRLLLTSLFSIAPDAIIAVDRDQRITHFNDAAENIFGYRRDEVLGQPLNLLLPGRFRALHTREFNKFGAAPEAARVMSERGGIFGLHKDGHEFPAEASICKLTLGEKHTYSVVLRDVTERKKVEAHNQLLIRELEHRVRNVLARVQILIQCSAGGSTFREALLDRVNSMMRSYELLSRTSWLGVTVNDLIADQLKPYVADHNSRIEGPEIVLNADATQALSMVIHELTTNAVKYGALSVPEGHVTVSWWQEPAQEARGQLVLQWREQGGPAVKPPKREGYGTNLVRELLTYEFDGTVDQRYSPEGLTCQIVLPLERVLEKPR
jgi:PAS domain S-box-containing protein